MFYLFINVFVYIYITKEGRKCLRNSSLVKLIIEKWLVRRKCLRTYIYMVKIIFN
jgi:hypothetical protein